MTRMITGEQFKEAVRRMPGANMEEKFGSLGITKSTYYKWTRGQVPEHQEPAMRERLGHLLGVGAETPGLSSYTCEDLLAEIGRRIDGLRRNPTVAVTGGQAARHGSTVAEPLSHSTGRGIN